MGTLRKSEVERERGKLGGRERKRWGGKENGRHRGKESGRKVRTEMKGSEIMGKVSR